MIQLKRVYDTHQANGGFRVLVDRLWPRGISKEDAQIDLWLKDIAPSTTLRKWFGHDPKKWQEFQTRYKKEIRENPKPLEQLRSIVTEHKDVVFLFGAKDTEHNHAVVLLELLKKV